MKEVFQFELAYQARRAWTWLFAVAVLVFTYLLATQAYVNEARAQGYLFNGPFVIAHVVFLGSLPGLLIAALLAGDAAARDVHTRIHPLLYTTAVGKRKYLGGRFLAAFVMTALILLGAPVAHLLATWLPALEPELLGPFRPAAYLRAYLFVVLPNAFLATSLAFACALFSRRAMVSYLASVTLFFLSVFCWMFLATRLGRWELATVLDPLGTVPMGELSRKWTPAEMSTRMLRLEGSLLGNRVTWVAIGALVMAFTILRFRFAHVTIRSLRRRAARRHADTVVASETPSSVPKVRTSNRLAMQVGQSLTVALDSFREFAFGWGGVAVLLLTLLTVLAGPSWFTHLGVPLTPTTARMLDFLVVPLANSGEILWTVVPLLVIYYAGELFWRERDTGLSEIADAAPLPDWALLVGKFLGLSFVLVGFELLSSLAGVLIQLRMGYHDFELGLYARTLLGLQLVDFLLFALLSLFVHVLINQKYIAHMALLVAYAYLAFAPTIGIEHHLLVYAGAPDWRYSDLGGFGGSIVPWLWFKLYWAAWALLLGVLARLFWVRGREQSLRQRLNQAHRRFAGAPALTSAVALGLIVLLGGFIFYNTNVLNAHHSVADQLAQRAEYERRYAYARNTPQPQLTATTLEVELYPEQHSVRMRGTHTLRNQTVKPLDTIYVSTSNAVQVQRLSFERSAQRVLADERLGYYTHVLHEPLQPGDSVRLHFELAFQPRGFANQGVATAVTPNSTYFTNSWLPAIGYQPGRELTNAGERRKYALPARGRAASLNDVAARSDLRGEERIALAATISTTMGQTALAPGRLLRSWSQHGRRYFQYVTDAPIRNDYAVFSARYAVQEARWRDVRIEVVHHPEHTRVLPHVLRSVAATLAYQTRHYGPYPYRQLRLVERAGHEPELHAFPINISYQEGFANFNPAADQRDLDFAFAVVAHEVAHQWWGNQLIPAPVEGAPVLSESLAWYSAFGAVEATYGRAHLERLLDVMRAAYLDPRSRAGVPLLRAYDRFMAYRKGPLVLYALREYVGETAMNSALRELLREHAAGEPPLPTSMDLYAQLQAVTPDSLRPLLSDLFQRNTYWELATRSVTRQQRNDGSWQVTLEVSARKLEVDTAAVEKEVPMNDLIEIGVFAGAVHGSTSAPLHLQKHRIRSGTQRITLVVRQPPTHAGIDPRQLLIDDAPTDNVRAIDES